MPDSVIPPGRLIPAGQLWGGSPVCYERDLTEQEILNNYAMSYVYGASEFNNDLLWPH